MPGFDPEATAPVRRPAAAARPAGPTQVGAARPAPDEQARPAAATSPEEGRPARDDRPVLPDITTDEREVGWGDLPEPGDDDRYLREIPPHHGG